MSAVLSDATSSLPLGWYWSTIGEVADVVGGGTPRTDDAANFENGDIPWITPADLSGYTEKYISQGARFITQKGLASSSARLLPAETVLFTSRAPIGYVAIARNPVATNQGFKSFILKPGLLSEYVFWWLKGSKQRAERLASGTTFLELSGANAKKIPIPIAPLEQQREIVAEIEKQFSRLDQAVASLQRVKAQLKRYKASVLKAAVEGRLVETEAERARREGRSFETGAELAAQGSANAAGGRKPGAALPYETGEQLLKRILDTRRSQWKGKGKYKEPAAPDTSGLPELPEGWVHATAEQLTDGNRAITYGVIKLGEPAGGGVPVLRSSDVRQLRIDLDNVKRISPEIAENYRRTFLKGGEVVMTIRGTLGGIAVVPPQCNGFNVSREVAMLALLDPQMAQLAAVFVASAPLENWLMRRTKGIAYTGINIETLKALPIPVPPIVEQHRIVAEVDRRLSIVREVEAEMDANLKRAQALRQSVLGAAFSGRLTGNAAAAAA